MPENYVWKIINMPEFCMILARKIIQMFEFLWYLPEKLTKFPNFTWFARKMSEFYITIARKIFPNISCSFEVFGPGTCPLRLCLGLPTLNVSHPCALQVVYNEFEGFSCHSYETEKPRRAQRQCNVFVSCPPLHLDNVRPIICGKVKVADNSRLLASRCADKRCVQGI